VAKLPDKLKPATDDEVAGKAVDRPLGVEGGGAHGRMSRGTWEAQRLGREDWTKLWQGINNLRGDRLGVGQARSSEEAGQCPWSEGA
jgi:hypothetical protein